jgi:hypothetical protein
MQGVFFFLIIVGIAAGMQITVDGSGNVATAGAQKALSNIRSRRLEKQPEVFLTQATVTAQGATDPSSNRIFTIPHKTAQSSDTDTAVVARLSLWTDAGGSSRGMLNETTSSATAGRKLGSADATTDSSSGKKTTSGGTGDSSQAIVEVGGGDSSQAKTGDCVDSAGWTSTRGVACTGPTGYQGRGWCQFTPTACGQKGGPVPGMEWTIGPAYGSPEDNCCVCGKEKGECTEEATTEKPITWKQATTTTATTQTTQYYAVQKSQQHPAQQASAALLMLTFTLIAS